jgi:hypothetical protein
LFLVFAPRKIKVARKYHAKKDEMRGKLHFFACGVLCDIITLVVTAALKEILFII